MFVDEISKPNALVRRGPDIKKIDRNSRAIVKMTGEKCSQSKWNHEYQRWSVNHNRSASERDRNMVGKMRTRVNRGAWTRIEEKQQIVVLKMREKRKKSFWLFIAHAQHTHAHTHVYIIHPHHPHLNWVVWKKRRKILPFFTICIPLRSCSSQACGNCILDSVSVCARAHLSFNTLIVWLSVCAVRSRICALFLRFCSFCRSQQAHFVQVKLPPVIMPVEIIQISFWVNVMRTTFDNGSFFSSFLNLVKTATQTKAKHPKNKVAKTEWWNGVTKKLNRWKKQQQ